MIPQERREIIKPEENGRVNKSGFSEETRSDSQEVDSDVVSTSSCSTLTSPPDQRIRYDTYLHMFVYS